MVVPHTAWARTTLPPDTITVYTIITITTITITQHYSFINQIRFWSITTFKSFTSFCHILLIPPLKGKKYNICRCAAASSICRKFLYFQGENLRERLTPDQVLTGKSEVLTDWMKCSTRSPQFQILVICCAVNMKWDQAEARGLSLYIIIWAVTLVA